MATPQDETFKQFLMEMVSYIQRSSLNQATVPVEVVPEALANSISEFSFDPENGLTFDRWYSKYEDSFLRDGENLEDAAKVRLLLRKLSVTVHDKYQHFILPKHPREFSFEDTVKKLKTLFGTRSSLFSKRYKCLETSMCAEEDFISYGARENKLCEDFEVNRLTADQFKSLIFVIGLRSPKVADFRTRLLAKLDEEGVELTLEKLVHECERMQNLKLDTALVEKKTSVDISLCAIKQNHPLSS